jgi:hypothetical protein
MKNIIKINEKNKNLKKNLENNSSSPFILRFEIHNATICSWCNQNVLGEGLNVLVTFKLEKGIICIYVYMY